MLPPDRDIIDQFDQFLDPKNGVMPIEVKHIHAERDYDRSSEIYGEGICHRLVLLR